MAERIAGAAARHFAVIGGGISGLAAAHRLAELTASREPPPQITLIERGPRLGGALHTIRDSGFVIEAGADSFISEKPWALALAKRLRMEGELVSTQERYRKTYVVRGGRLVEIPQGFSLIAPARMAQVWRSPIFSLRGKLRMAMEPLVRRRAGEGDESLASFVTRRLGREVLERIAQPLAGGIYTADPENLSLAATMPRFLEMERRHGSVIRGLRAAAATSSAERSASGARWSLFLSFRAGVSALVEALATSFGGRIRLGAGVREIVRDSERNLWRIVFDDQSIIEADGAICAAPAYEAARLLEHHDADLSAMLAAIAYSSTATVNLAYPLSDFPRPPDSFGFVVPLAEGRKIIAGSFSSLKFPGRAPEGLVLMRAFIGGTLQAAMMSLSDEAMVAAVREEFKALLGLDARPFVCRVERWPDSMPQYAVGHLDRVGEIERRARWLPGFALAGAAYRGVGIPDCVHSGEQAAEELLAGFEHRQ